MTEPTAGVLTGAAFADRLAGFAAIGLGDVRELPLLRRFDDKHLVPVAALPELLALLAGDFVALEVAGERVVTYHSRYFDTPDLATYHAHRQGRRRRFKVRTRHYGDPGRAVLEVKCKGARGGTVKYRTPHRGPAPDVLGPDGAAFVARTLSREYGIEEPPELAPTLETRFARTTLVGLHQTERLTIDRGLRVVAHGTTIAFRDDCAIVEAKTASRHPVSRPALHAVGARPERVSKYALGISALHPDLPSNRWRPAQRRLVA